MARTLIEWDAAAWDDVDAAVDAFAEGRDVFLRLRGPMREQRRNVDQAVTHMIPRAKIVDARDGDLGLFHPVTNEGGGDLDGDREPHRPRPSGNTGVVVMHPASDE